MNPEQLEKTTMDPAVRTLLQVRLEDVVEADQMFTTLMGSKVEPRKAFIKKYALYVTNLDVYGSQKSSLNLNGFDVEEKGNGTEIFHT